MIGHDTRTKVIVVGGGYAGTLAANRLRMRGDVEITLVNPRAEFVDRVRLHQFMAGTGDASVDYGTPLGEGVRLVVDDATRTDAAARQVRLASGHALDYDYVIYAVGSTATVSSAMRGAAEFACPIAEFESAWRLRARPEEVHADVPVTVVGGGFGRLLPDGALTSVDDDRIAAAGDAAAPSGLPLRMSCQASGPLGAQAADIVLSRIAGTGPAVINLALAGSCVSLGRHAALRQFAGRGDTAVNVHIGGRIGAVIKGATCKFTVSRIRREARKPGSVVWVKGGRRAEQPAVARVVTS
jgi:NADH dehydrogenase FAD-containing subunit